jgi:phosphoglycolate phosphatase-like HAD superfamily hydrolase
MSLNSFRWLEFDAYLFDIDGTLLTNRDLIHYRALNRAMRYVYGIDTTIDGIGYHGKTDLGILRAALAREGLGAAAFEARLADALDMVREQVHRNADAMRPRVCPGVPEVLAQLQAAEKLVAIASGNLESVGWHKVETAGLRRHFAYGRFCDEMEEREAIFHQAQLEAHSRLGPAARVCFVGDTPSDIVAARQVGASVVAVATGIYKQADLASYGPDACLNSCNELLLNVAVSPDQ